MSKTELKPKKTFASDLIIVNADEFEALSDNPIDSLDESTYHRIEKLACWFVLRVPLTSVTKLANPSLIDVFKSGETPNKGARTQNRNEFEQGFLVPMNLDCSKFEFVYSRKGMKIPLEDCDLATNDSSVFRNSNDVLEERSVCFVGKGYSDGKEDSCVESVFRHIRNAFAHGRIAVLSNGGDPYIFLEDGSTPRNIIYDNRHKPKHKLLEVRFRMVVRLSTLESWYTKLVPTAG